MDSDGYHGGLHWLPGRFFPEPACTAMRRKYTVAWPGQGLILGVEVREVMAPKGPGFFSKRGRGILGDRIFLCTGVANLGRSADTASCLTE